MTKTKLFARPENLVFLAHGCVDEDGYLLPTVADISELSA